MQQVSKRGLYLIAGFEGFRARAYYATPHEREKDTMTIGYGHLIDDTKEEHMRDLVLTEEEAMELLAKDAKKYSDAVVRFVGNGKLTQDQLDAATSFCYNVGIGNFQKSQFAKDLKAGLIEKAPNELKWWTRQAGTRLMGLVIRRAAEKVYFQTGNNITKDLYTGKAFPQDILGLD
jgi:lysozyme